MSFDAGMATGIMLGVNLAKRHPVSVVYDNTNDTITETWAKGDDDYTVQTYTITVTGKGTTAEAVTAITFPDGSEMSLEGF